MRRRVGLLIATVALLALPSTVGAHLLDHAPPAFNEAAPPGPEFTSGGEDADWELVATLPTGNPHTDLDFFTRGGETYASVGTLGNGPNAGGQTIAQLTENGAVKPRVVSSHPSASCVSNPEAALGLQHDVEASPKGGTILNTFNPAANPGEAQILVDASDAEGRCHDQGVGGLAAAPRGGLEIIDVAELLSPTDDGLTSELGLTSHIGESHTVNIDPRRPHIAYSVTSDAVSVRDTDGDGVPDKRENEIEGDNDQFDLDGFEVVDMSSCMYFPAGTSVQAKRDACRPQVYRYRYPTLGMSQGHTNKATVYGCHELEVYPDDRLTCGSGGSLIVLDMKGAFDDRGTPADFTDDKPRGQALPCRVRDSSTALPEFRTGAKVIDCVDGAGDGTDDLSVPKWLASGAPVAGGRPARRHRVPPGSQPSEQDRSTRRSPRPRTSTSTTRPSTPPPAASCSPPTSAAAA